MKQMSKQKQLTVILKSSILGKFYRLNFPLHHFILTDQGNLITLCGFRAP